MFATVVLVGPDFPGSKSVSEAATKVGPAYVSGPVLFVLEKVSTFIPAPVEEEKNKEEEEKKEEAVPPPAEAETSTEEVKEKEVAVEAPVEDAPPAADPPKP